LDYSKEEDQTGRAEIGEDVENEEFVVTLRWAKKPGSTSTSYLQPRLKFSLI
jgi:hypothetical protein